LYAKASPQSTFFEKLQLTIQQRLRRGKDFFAKFLPIPRKFFDMFSPIEKFSCISTQADALDGNQAARQRLSNAASKGLF
jgi:hypothetical protein